IPKSGTHLLTKTLSLLTDTQLHGLWDSPTCKEQHYLFPPAIRLTEEQFLSHFPEHPGQNLLGHLNLSYVFHAFAQSHPDYVPVIMIRDLRDVLVSEAYFLNFPNTLEEMLHYLLHEVDETSVWNMKRHAEEALIWLKDPRALIIRYENLIGPKGG